MLTIHPARRLLVGLAFFGLGFLASCGGGGGGGGNDRQTAQADNNAEYAAQLRSFVLAQQITGQAPVRFDPATADWRFLEDVVTAGAASRSTAQSISADGADGFVLSFGVSVAGHRRCATFGPYSVWRALGNACPGEWLQFRGDARSTGASSLRLNWSQAPATHSTASLGMQVALDANRLLVASVGPLGEVAFVQNGGGVEAFSRSGQSLWRNNALGLGEIIDVVDLDGDGAQEVVFSTFAAAQSGPGALHVLSTATGELLWQHRFQGLEYGANRYRTTVTSLDGGATRSILVVMTYSAGLMRFDFDQGSRKGRLAWRSAAMVYDGPSKPPLVLDVDGDGRIEVLVDSHGVLYAFNATDGSLKSQVRYADKPTFGGFLEAADLDGDGRPEIVSFSNCAYIKGYAVVAWANGGLQVRRSVVWETDIENNQVQLRNHAGLLPATAGRPAQLLVSMGRTGMTAADMELQTIEPLSGAVTGRLSGYALANNVSLRAARPVVMAAAGAAAALIDVTDSPRPLARFENQTWVGNDYQLNRAASHRTERADRSAILADATGTLRVVAVDAANGVASAVIGGLAMDTKVTAHAVDGQSVVLSDGANGYRVATTGNAAIWFTHTPRSFPLPLVADLDGNGQRELVVPYGKSLSRLTWRNRGIAAVKEVFSSTVGQSPQAAGLPIVIDEGLTGRRSVVAFNYADDAAAAVECNGCLSARSASGQLMWRYVKDRDNWEYSIAAVKAADGLVNVGFRDSRTTAVLNGLTGELLWRSTIVGQCQRQMASLDWNGDGVDDLAVQAGETSWIHDGATGKVLWTQVLSGSYGAYSAMAHDAANAPMLIQHNAGAVAFISRTGLLADLQLDERRLEALPVVLGARASNGGEWVFQVNGSGLLRVHDLAGNLRDSTDIAASVVAMTGAYIDSDAAVDLLVSTLDGRLIAVSGSTLKVLWEISLGAAVSTAVATDLDGDGRGEIVVITSDGMLHVLQP